MPSSNSTPGAGETPDAETLFGALYSELHRLARRQLSLGGRDADLGVTTLLHEAYLDISARHGTVFPDEARFMGYAARVMRGLIIDHARAAHAAKRGGEFQLTTLSTDAFEVPADPQQLTAISNALDELAAIDQPLAEIVDLRFFCGFSFEEIGALRGISTRTAKRKWEKARIYLHGRLSGRG